MIRRLIAFASLRNCATAAFSKPIDFSARPLVARPDPTKQRVAGEATIEFTLEGGLLKEAYGVLVPAAAEPAIKVNGRHARHQPSAPPRWLPLLCAARLPANGCEQHRHRCRTTPRRQGGHRGPTRLLRPRWLLRGSALQPRLCANCRRGPRPTPDRSPAGLVRCAVVRLRLDPKHDEHSSQRRAGHHGRQEPQLQPAGRRARLRLQWRRAGGERGGQRTLHPRAPLHRGHRERPPAHHPACHGAIGADLPSACDLQRAPQHHQFHLQPALWRDTHGPAATAVVFSFSEPYGARQWWPCKDLPDDKPTTTIQRITVPAGAGWQVVSNGKLTSKTSGGGNETWVWTNSFPMATYLLSICISNYTYSNATYTALDAVTTMPISHAIFPENVGTEGGAAAGTLAGDELLRPAVRRVPVPEREVLHGYPTGRRGHGAPDLHEHAGRRRHAEQRLQRRNRPRTGAPVVRRPDHLPHFRPPLAQRGLCHLLRGALL